MKSFEIAADIKPTERQLAFQDNEFYAIIYYGMNTFLSKEISDGCAVPEMFCPENIDTDEWAETVKNGGMNGIILTAKHYDGFCNWPTNTTDYSVKNSNWISGDGDLIKLVAESCRKIGLKFGLYIPVWDIHELALKKNKSSFNDYFIAQIKELISNYGKLFEIMIDDRCDDENVSFDVDFGEVYSLIREVQPECAITFRGPDGRWIGNNRGVTRTSEWNVIPSFYGYNEDGSIPASKKKKKVGQMEIDLGSSKAIKGETDFIWYPCEVNYPMHAHWFYKKDDEYTSKTKDKILDIYFRTVGNNANLMLGIVPDKHGKLHDTDKQILKATGRELKLIFGYNLFKDGKISASSTLSKLYQTENLLEDNELFWCPDENDKKPELTVKFDKPEMFDKIVIKEHIRNGQHVEEFSIYIDVKGKWKKFVDGTTIGHKTICAVKPVETQAIKIVFKKFRKNIEISMIQAN